MGFVLEALEPAGNDIVRCRFAWRRMLPPDISPFSDITSTGGWMSLTGQQLWLVSSVFPFLLAPVFASPDSLVSMVEVQGGHDVFFVWVGCRGADLAERAGTDVRWVHAYLGGLLFQATSADTGTKLYYSAHSKRSPPKGLFASS